MNTDIIIKAIGGIPLKVDKVVCAEPPPPPATNPRFKAAM